MAKKFAFKLEPVLRYRERIEEQVRSRFLQAQQIQVDKEQEILKIEADRHLANEQMLKSKTGNLDVNQLKTMNRYMTGLGISQQMRQGELRLIEGEVEKRRGELVHAKREVHVMEKLKDKRRKEFEYELEREETKNFDEIALQKNRAKLLEEQRWQEMTARRRLHDDHMKPTEAEEPAPLEVHEGDGPW